MSANVNHVGGRGTREQEGKEVIEGAFDLVDIRFDGSQIMVLGGPVALVPHQFLELFNGNPSLAQINSKAVAQDMRDDALGESGLGSGGFDNLANRTGTAVETIQRGIFWITAVPAQSLGGKEVLPGPDGGWFYEQINV